MNIEYTTPSLPQKKRFLPKIVLVLLFLLLIPTTLVIIGSQKRKQPTGNLISPLPQGQLSQASPTPTPTKTLIELTSFSQTYLDKAITLSLNTPQSEIDKKQIINYLEQSLDYSNQAVLTYPQQAHAYLLRAKVLTSISQTNPDALTQAKNDLETAEQLAQGQAVSLPEKINPLEVIPSQQASLPQNLIIASPQQSKQTSISDQNDSNTNINTVTLPAGQTQLEITDPQVTSSSYIYLIPQEKTNQTVFVESKKNGSFTISTNQPLQVDLSLDYWLINH